MVRRSRKKNLRTSRRTYVHEEIEDSGRGETPHTVSFDVPIPISFQLHAVFLRSRWKRRWEAEGV